MSKALTLDQLESRKRKAEAFVRNVLDDPERADEIEDESLEDYAARRRIEIANPRRSTRRNTMPSNKELQQRIRELEDENEELQDQLDAIADIAAPAEEDQEGPEDDED